MAGTVVIAVMMEVIVNEARMKEKKIMRKVASRTPVQAGTSTERLTQSHSGGDERNCHR